MAYSFEPTLKKWQSLVRELLDKVQDIKNSDDDFFRTAEKPPEQIKAFFDGIESKIELVKEDVKSMFLIQFQLHEMLAEEIKNSKMRQLEAEIADFEMVKERKRTLALEKENLLKKEIAEKEAQKEEVFRQTERPVTAQVVLEEEAHEELNEQFARHEPSAPETAPSQAADDEEQEVTISPELKAKIGEVLDRASSEKPSLGLLGYLDYSNWFLTQPRSVQEDIMGVFCADPRFKPEHMFFKKIEMLPPVMAGYLWKTANVLMKKKHDDIAVKLLIKGLTIVTNKVDKEMIHIIYAKYFYRQRKELEGAYDGCINHSMKAIKSFLADTENRDKPVAPFKLLTQIYEEKQEYERIVEVCDKAIQLFSKHEPKRAKQFMKIKKVLEKKLNA